MGERAPTLAQRRIQRTLPVPACPSPTLFRRLNRDSRQLPFKYRHFLKTCAVGFHDEIELWQEPVQLPVPGARLEFQTARAEAVARMFGPEIKKISALRVSISSRRCAPWRQATRPNVPPPRSLSRRRAPGSICRGMNCSCPPPSPMR